MRGVGGCSGQSKKSIGAIEKIDRRLALVQSKKLIGTIENIDSRLSRVQSKKLIKKPLSIEKLV